MKIMEKKANKQTTTRVIKQSLKKSFILCHIVISV